MAKEEGEPVPTVDPEEEKVESPIDVSEAIKDAIKEEEVKEDVTVDTTEDAKEETKEDTKVDTKEDTRISTQEDTKADIKEDKVEIKEDTKVETQEENKADIKEDTKVDTKDDTREDTKEVTIEETKEETKEGTKEPSVTEEAAPVKPSVDKITAPVKKSESKVEKVEKSAMSVRGKSGESEKFKKGSSQMRWSFSSKNLLSKVKMSSLISIKRASITSYGERGKIVRYANTYKLESENPFNVDAVQKILRTILMDYLVDEMHYNPEDCSNHAITLCKIIRDQVKEQRFERYKLICMVTVGEKKSQDMHSIVRFLWDSERDRFALFFHENMHIFIAAIVFGLYFE